MIAMHVLHSLPPCMRTLQTMLIQSTPPVSSMTWNLDELWKDIEADELRAQAAGENLGTKLDLVDNPNALNTDSRPKGKKKDPNDPVWLA